MISFNKIVNKLSKYWWKVIFKTDIFDLIDPEKKEKYNSYIDKLVYRLKSNWFIVSIKSGVYIVPTLEDKKLNKIDLIDKYYLKLLKKYISFYVWSSYIIWWKKSLEFHLKDFSIPEKIFIINRSLNKKIKVWDYLIVFKTSTWNKDSKKINLYNKLSNYLVIKNIDSIDFKIFSLELSLLEASIIWDNENWLDIWLLNKAIKKYKWFFQTEVFFEIWKYKYIMGFNRLKEISKNIDKDLYLIFLDVIKKNGGLFIWEWLRGF